MEKEGFFESLGKALLGAALAGLIFGIILQLVFKISLWLVMDIVVMTMVAEIMCRLRLANSGIKQTLPDIMRVLGVVAVFVCLRVYIGSLFGFSYVSGLSLISGKQLIPLTQGDVALECAFLVPGALFAYLTIYSKYSERLAKYFVALSVVCFVLTAIAVRCPGLTSAMSLVGQSSGNVVGKIGDFGVSHSVTTVKLTGDMGGELYQFEDGEYSLLSDLVGDKLLALYKSKVAKGAEIQILAATPLYPNGQRLQQIRIKNGSDFVKGVTLYVLAEELTKVAPDWNVPAQKASGPQSSFGIGRFFSGVAKKVSGDDSTVVAFKANQQNVFTGIMLKGGETVTYTEVQAPFKVTGKNGEHVVDSNAVHVANIPCALTIAGCDRDGSVRIRVSK